MTWFEAYMLWRLDAIQGLCIGVVIACGVYHIIGWMAYSIEHDYMEDETKATLVKWFKRSAIVCAVCVLLIAIIPSTTELMKIIATKKGVDAIQSDTAAKYLGEVDKTITNGLKVLNQEIEKKLDKKGSK